MANGFVTPAFGLSGAEDALRRGAQASSSISAPFAERGLQAFDLQAALSGALGPDAQRLAFDEFQASPGQEFLRDTAERSLLRNEAAIGGLGGGNVRTALQEQAIGLASQDFGNQFGRLGEVATQGGGFARDIAGLLAGTGQQLAGARERAGTSIASAVSGTTSALADLTSRQGEGLSSIIGSGAGDLSSILSRAGETQALSDQQLAALLANIATGSASQVSGLPGIPGIQETEGSLGSIGNLLTGIGTLGIF